MRSWLALLVLGLSVSCGGGRELASSATPSTLARVDPASAPVTRDAALPGLPPLRSADAAPPFSRSQYRALPASTASVVLSLRTQADGSQQVWAQVDGAVTDLMVDLALPQPARGYSVEWTPAAQGFIQLAQPAGMQLSLALAGRLAQDIQVDTTPQQFQQALAQRRALRGMVQLCTLRQGAAASELRVAAAAQLTAPEGLEVTAGSDAHAGHYQLGWPGRLSGDYDQNGEVNAADITPLGILFGLKRGSSPDWLLEAQRRVDGDGNGEINSSDLQPLGQNYKVRIGSYNVERSVGDASGPSATWTAVASDVKPSAQTRYGDAITSLGAAPFQQVLDPVQPGWVYYRLTYVAPDGTLSPPGSPVLAPDVTPPAWAGGGSGNLAFTVDQGTFPKLTFDDTATDDRGGNVEYQVVVRAGTGSPEDKLPIVADIIYNKTSTEAIASPYDFNGYYADGAGQASAGPVPFRNGVHYVFQVRVVDTAGNHALSGSTTFDTDPGSQLPGPSSWDLAAINNSDIIQLAVSRDGSVKFTPPPIIYSGAANLKFFYYARVAPKDSGLNESDFNTYSQTPRAEFDGGPVLLPQVLAKGQELLVCVQTQDDFGTSEVYGNIFRPDYWFKPFEPAVPGPALSPYLVQYVDDGTPFMFEGANNTGKQMLTFAGDAYYADSLAGLVIDNHELNKVKRITATGELLIQNTEYDFSANDVYWYKPHKGLTGRVSIPPPALPGHNGLADDTVLQWNLDDADTVSGVRNTPQTQPDNTLGLEVWEAKRDGSYRVREILQPPGLAKTKPALWGRKINGHYVVEQLIKVSLLDPTLYEYDSQQPDGSWLVSSPTDLPAAFDSAPWQNARVTWFHPGEPDSYVVVEAVDDPNKAQEDQIVYTGLYQGDAMQGIKSFTKVWEIRTGQAVDPAYPDLVWGGYQGGDTLFNPAFPGLFYSPLNVKSLGAKGYGGAQAAFTANRQIQHAFLASDLPEYAVIATSTDSYFQDGKAKPGFGRGILSPDGQWAQYVTGQTDGVWGTYYKLP